MPLPAAGTSARSDFVTTSVSSRRTATFHLKIYLPRCPKRGVKGCPNVGSSSGHGAQVGVGSET